MKIYWLIILFFSFNYTSAQNGFKIGLNISDYIINETTFNGSNHESIFGPYLGYFNDWNLNGKSNGESYFSLGYEICISAKGSLLKDFITYSEVTPSEITDTSDVKKFFYYIELPHLVKFHYALTDRVKLEMDVGGAFSLLVLYGTKTLEHSNPNYSRNETNFFFVPNLGEIPTSFIDYSLVGGLGIYYDDILFNVRYTTGLVQVYTNTTLSTLTLTVGYKI
ncbi:MAG: hypothetical protein IPJ23_12505 [Ignavibacteriales bacterium]|nr:hypothetical protein [Ignavibacteriales bacterium]